MTYEEFVSSAASERPPEGLSDALLALWYAEKGVWEKAHETAQDIASPDGSWIHAHLHREEGDIGNAHYWYRNAGQPPSNEPIETEREALVRHFLSS